MIRSAYFVIFDFRFSVFDSKSQPRNILRRADPAADEGVWLRRSSANTKDAPRFAAGSFISRFRPCRPAGYVLLILACAFQMQVFAEDSADNLNLFPPSANRKSELPSATEILAQVRASLPREALLVKGQILSGGRLGKLERVCYIEMFLDFGADPAIVRYKISDTFGTPLEQMTISMTEGGETEYEYETGNPLKAEPAPQPTGVIMDTDVTWNDLSLLFLWRADGRTTRTENLRGRDCYVLEFPGTAGLIENLQVVWIDMQMLVLIQMEELGGDGRLQRRMIVKNIKKISEQWMIKNLEIRAYPSFHHTLIRIDEVGP